MVLPVGSFVKTSESGGRMETGRYTGTGNNQFVSLPFVPRKVQLLNWDTMYEALWEEPMVPSGYIRVPDSTGLHKHIEHFDMDGITPISAENDEGGPGFMVEPCHGQMTNAGETIYWIAWE